MKDEIRAYKIYFVVLLVLAVAFFFELNEAMEQRKRADMLQGSYTNATAEIRKLMHENQLLREMVEEDE